MAIVDFACDRVEVVRVDLALVRNCELEGFAIPAPFQAIGQIKAGVSQVPCPIRIEPIKEADAHPFKLLTERIPDRLSR